MTRVCGAIVLVVGLAMCVRAQERERITIYIGPQIRDGFIDMDAGIRDSIKDIQQECQSAGLSVVASTDAATISVIVLGRGLPVKGDVGFGTGSVTGGTGVAFAMTVPNAVPTITTSLRVGHYERTASREGGTWRNAAKMVADDLKAWIEANRGVLK